MNFAFTEEQEQLRQFVRSFLEDKSAEAAVREQMDTENGYDQAVWSQMADQLGLQSLVIPEAYGGQGYSFVELGVVLEEMGRALLCAPYFSGLLAAQAIVHSGDEGAMSAHLPGIASGETIAALAFTEENGKWDEAGVTMEASASGDGHTLSGVKSFVIDGHTANLIIVAAKTGAGVSLFAVNSDASGLTREALATMDQTRKQAKLTFDNTPGDPHRDRRCRLGHHDHGARPRRHCAGRRAGRWRPDSSSTWRCSTPRIVCSSVVRSVRSRRSSTSAPTCCSRSSRRSRLRTTAVVRCGDERRTAIGRCPGQGLLLRGLLPRCG